MSTARSVYGLTILIALAALCMKGVDTLTPSTTPEQIVQSQLSALQNNDMSGVYEFASPANKQRTGDVNTFGQMVRTGPYKYLVGHKKADILLTSNMAASKQYLVRVVPTVEAGKPTRIVEYWWSLSRCKSGPHKDCYMVDAVIPNA